MATPSETLQTVLERAGQLKAAGRVQEALALYSNAAQRFPANGFALHNLAATLGDLGQHAKAADVARAALRTGLDAPETWLVLARATQGEGDLQGAQRAYAEVLRRRPGMLPAQLEAAQLVWMTTGNQADALRAVDEALKGRGADPMLGMVKAQALEFMGDGPAALASLAVLLAQPGCPAPVLAYASHLAAQVGETMEGLQLAERAVQAAPGDPGALQAQARARLAVGDARGAMGILESLLQRHPNDQHLLALLAVAWRLLGDPRYPLLYDYGRFVRAQPLDLPPGWSDLPAYVAALAAELKAAHLFHTHPFGHSLRQGSQLPDVLRRTSPAIAAFPRALSGPLQAYLAQVGRGAGPFPSRNTGQAALAGSWSVWLRPGGHHVDHVHQEGWISSACYVDLPEAIGNGDRQGWLRLGRPGTVLAEDLVAEHWIRPEPGLVVFFPSYMWHGTEPFSGGERRLTIAFDLVPA